MDDDEHDTMVVRRALRIIGVEDPSASMRYYTFKPWMSMCGDPDTMQVLNPIHIISEAKPAKVALMHYNDILKDIKNEPLEYDTLADSDDLNITERLIDGEVLH